MHDPARPKTHNGDLAHLPTALEPLTEAKRWVNWSWKRREAKDGTAKWTKPPLRPSNLRNASSTDPETWNTYRRASQRVQDGEADGIGFMLLDSTIGAIDLDDCCERNAKRRKIKIDDWACALREEADGTYCEVTVSGHGLRLIGSADGDKVHRRFAIPDARPNAAIEVFRKAERFITISGLQLGQCDHLPSLDSVIDTVVRRYGNAPRPQASAERHSERRDFDYLIRHGAREGERSEAFQAVVWHLASQGRSIDDIVDELARHPDGIGLKYADRLQQEVARSFEKWQRQSPTRSHDLPIIKVEAGKIARVVDESQAALLGARLPIFVRGGRLMEPITVEREAADGRSTTTTVFAALSKEKIGYLLNKQAAIFQRFDGRREIWVATNPPVDLAGTEVLAVSRGGRHRRRANHTRRWLDSQHGWL
jgi:hypothetical protein